VNQNFYKQSLKHKVRSVKPFETHTLYACMYYVCMHVCMYVCVYISIAIYLSICLSIYLSIYMYSDWWSPIPRVFFGRSFMLLYQLGHCVFMSFCCTARLIIILSQHLGQIWESFLFCCFLSICSCHSFVKHLHYLQVLHQESNAETEKRTVYMENEFIEAPECITLHCFLLSVMQCLS
jgi:hypothetical protein